MCKLKTEQGEPEKQLEPQNNDVLNTGFFPGVWRRDGLDAVVNSS